MMAVFAAVTLIICSPVKAQNKKDKKRTATCFYHIDPNESENDAKAKALNKARTDAIEKAFGTFVSSNSTSVYQQNNDKYYDGYFNLNSCDVRGMWLADGEPKFEFIFDAKNERCIRVEEKGYAVQLGGSTQLDIRLLRGGLDPDKNKVGPHDIYKEGDRMYTYFSSPVDGYLMLYLVDNDNIKNPRVGRLLPYPSENGDGDALPVKANHPYIFFSEEKAEPELAEITQELIMECPNRKRETDMDFNIIYVIFSREPFTKATDDSAHTTGVPTTRMVNFQKWLVKRLQNDNELVIDKIGIAISKE